MHPYATIPGRPWAETTSLGDEAFMAAWDAGQVLAPEHAVTEALAATVAPARETTRQTL